MVKDPGEGLGEADYRRRIFCEGEAREEETTTRRSGKKKKQVSLSVDSLWYEVPELVACSRGRGEVYPCFATQKNGAEISATMGPRA